MHQIGPLEWIHPEAFVAMAIHIFSNLCVVLGVAFLLCYFLFYLTALSRMELSYVLPMTASSYVFTAVVAWSLLGETISVTRWIGTCLICCGILLVNRSERRKQAQPEEWVPATEEVAS